MLSAVGQLATVLIGIPPLIYLAVQIREQTKERRQTAVNALTGQWAISQKPCTTALSSVSFTLAACSRSAIWMGRPNFGLARFKIASFITSRECISPSCDGILTPSLWGKIERAMSDFLAYPGVRQWWATRKHWYTEEFARLVDGIIARSDEPTMYATYNIPKA